MYNLLMFLSMFCTVCYSQEISGIKDTIRFKTQTTATSSDKGFDFFASEEPLEMRLRFDVREFLKSRNDPEYLDATLTVFTGEHDSVSQHIKLKVRGNMRLESCAFPPIMLKFKDNKNESEPIQGHGTIKLVTPCNQTKSYENYVIREYLAYRLYNLLTPYSFKTRLVKIHYSDVSKRDHSFTAYGFLIENEDQMALRNNAVVIGTRNITQKQMIPSEMARVAVFNYMIGNTDWSVPYQHNIKILKSLVTPSDKGIPVAYDFDYSGFVNTPYAAPCEQLPIREVTERYYTGLCFSEEEMRPILDEFSGMKNELLRTIHNFEYLPDYEKKRMEVYVSSYYKQYRRPEVLLSDLNRTCKRF